MGFAGVDILSGGGTDYADIAEQNEKQRQGNIKKGTSAIDSAFSGFNPQFYQNYEQAVQNNLMPQLYQQYGQTKNAISYDLGNRGLSRSGTASTQWDNLANAMNQGRTNVVNQSRQAGQNLQQQVQSAENQELSNLYSSADPAQAKESALGTAAGFAVPNTTAVLTNQFSNLLNSYYTNNLINQYGQQTNALSALQTMYGGQQQ